MNESHKIKQCIMYHAITRILYKDNLAESELNYNNNFKT